MIGNSSKVLNSNQLFLKLIWFICYERSFPLVFTPETENPWPYHFEHSHWWKWRSRSKFASHYAQGINGACMSMQDGCNVYLGSYMASNGSLFHGLLSKTSSYTQTMRPWHSETLKTVDFVLFYHARGPLWIEIHQNSIWLRARSHMTSHYTWRLVSTLHDFGSALGWHLDIFFRALTISWSRLLARMWSGPWG